MAFQNVAVGEPLVHLKELIALNDGGLGNQRKTANTLYIGEIFT